MSVYLTGGSGYLGGELIITMFEDKNMEGRRVDVPVREKRGMTGEERFEKLGKDSAVPEAWKTARYVDPAAPIPDDCQVVVLNAFDVAFHKDVAKVLRESVKPLLAYVEQCRELRKKGNLKQIVIVSTAFVQPPLPFTRCNSPITPFNGAADPWGTYNALLEGKLTWDDLVAHPENNYHSTQNAYIYAKTLTEHLIQDLCKSQDLPQVYIVRPSIIGPTADGERGSPATPGCASVRLMMTPLGRFMPSSGCSDNVFVCDVAKRIVQATTMVSPPEPNKDCNGVSGSANPMIMWATNGLPSPFHTVHANVSPWKWIIYPPKRWLPFLIWCESWVAYIMGGKRASKALVGFYRSYTHFTTHTWDFEQYSPTTSHALAVASVYWVNKYEKMLKDRKAAKKLAGK